MDCLPPVTLVSTEEFKKSCAGVSSCGTLLMFDNQQTQLCKSKKSSACTSFTSQPNSPLLFHFCRTLSRLALREKCRTHYHKVILIIRFFSLIQLKHGLLKVTRLIINVSCLAYLLFSMAAVQAMKVE